MDILVYDFLIWLTKKLYRWIPGGIIAGGIGFTSFCIFSLIFIEPRFGGRGFEYPLWTFVCAFVPLAVILGAFGSFFATHLAMRINPEIPHNRIARLTGALIGFGAGIAAGIILLYFLS